MQAHASIPHLLLHDNDALAKALGAGIAERKTIYEWPLSCVQQVTLVNGERWVYKSQLPPTVEPSFYAAASSPLLPEHQLPGKLGDCETMAIAWIDAPLLSESSYTTEGYLAKGKELVTAIGDIKGALPAWLDIGTQDGWLQATDSTLVKLRHLLANGYFKMVTTEMVAAFEYWAKQTGTIDRVTDGARLTHSDLKADQVFIMDGGHKVIDWQRPVITHPVVDLVSFLLDRKLDAGRFVERDIIKLHWFLRIYWTVVSQHDLFPGSRWPLFGQWMSEALNNIIV